MNIEAIRNYCLKKPLTTEEFPFGEDTLVYKVHGKMFALTGLSKPDRVNLKCDPLLAIELREKYASVIPGFHMNKKHWNTIVFDGSVSDSQIEDWIDHSYECVVAGLSKKIQENIRLLNQ
jgi:predicted DNA-binding protein (MmcQ/YjbR family)